MSSTGAAAPRPYNPRDVKHFVKMHRAMDRDKDGVVTRPELERYKGKVQAKIEEIEYKEWIHLDNANTFYEKQHLKKKMAVLEIFDSFFAKFAPTNAALKEGIRPQNIYDVAAKDKNPYDVSDVDLA